MKKSAKLVIAVLLVVLLVVTLVVKPTVPTKAGHIFEGWYKDSNFATIFDFETELLTKDITIYAKWSNLLSFEETTDGGVALIKYSGSEESVVVPSIYNGKPVTSIKQGAFEGCNNLTSITLPFVGGTLDGEDSTVFGHIFGASRYSDNKTFVPASLKTVVITGGTNIKDNAFRYCGSLTSVTIPDSATSIGKWAFDSCGSLASVTIGSGVKNIGSNAFQYCKGLTSIVIPDSVESIEKEAFRKCSGLTSIKIGSGVKSIGNYAFEDCSSLTGVTIPKSVTSIGSMIFNYCSGLTSIKCRAASQPSGWDAMWLNGCKVKPTFGYTGA